MIRLVNIKNKSNYKKLQKVIDSFPEYKLKVVKYNEGWNRADGKRSTIKPGLESDDVVQIIDDNGDTWIDWYVEDFKSKKIINDMNEIIKGIDKLKITEEEKNLFRRLSKSIIKKFNG